MPRGIPMPICGGICMPPIPPPIIGGMWCMPGGGMPCWCCPIIGVGAGFRDTTSPGAVAKNVCGFSTF